ncbi:hypothetical protein CIW83_02795 [Tissierella sp. P1]|uniref:hypothetical protein n=1 Tax=Tissierella sp. P1 TaxID=1280483 RepID=UPI000B9FC5F5|nr:hypothetical protein [Tissierella sp. P1]OZV13490.1 hypothetical protein CIW83_02795 [Tissierella sp. P1]
MIVTAWSSGKRNCTDSGYGFKISRDNIDRVFNSEWKFVVLGLEGEEKTIDVNINKSSFRKNCREFINKDIGLWLIKNGYGNWEKGEPPKFKMEQICENRFKVFSENIRK